MRLSRRQFLAAGASACALAPYAPSQLWAADAPDVSWLKEVQTRPENLPADTPKLPSLLVDEAGQPITTLEGWEKRRAELRRRWLEFLGPLKAERPAPQLTVLEEDRPEGVIRQLVRYESEPGIPVEGYLLRPAGKVQGKRPGVVALHSTAKETIRQPAGLEGAPEKAFGLKLAQRGFVTFCPRCFLWQGAGDYKDLVAKFQARHPGSKGMAKMLFDSVRAVDVLAAQSDVDPARLGAVGHSLGGKETLYLAAFDERIRCTVSSEGGVGVGFSNWDAVWYLSDAAKTPEFKLSHHEVLALAAPRHFLLVGGDSADGAKSWPYIEAVMPVYALYGAPGRVGLYNHKKGHAVPPEAEERIYEWIVRYL